MATTPDLVPPIGFASGGLIIAAWLARLVINFQRDFTDRYSAELRRVARDRDAWQRRATTYATLLARNGIQVPDDVVSEISGDSTG
jgi:hypothetical protein